jgi:galactokinase/mevalonate kinase-like predicted kinase
VSNKCAAAFGGFHLLEVEVVELRDDPDYHESVAEQTGDRAEVKAEPALLQRGEVLDAAAVVVRQHQRVQVREAVSERRADLADDVVVEEQRRRIKKSSIVSI